MTEARTPAKLLLALVSLTLSLGLAELIARYVYEPPLDIEGLEFIRFKKTGNFTPPLNSMGLREEPPGAEAYEPHVQRILFLGDSFTFGDGIKRGEDRFTDLIEARLNVDAAEAADPRRFHVYNAGVPGSRPGRWLRVLHSLHPVYKPDVVVAVFFLRDGTNLCTSLRCHEETIRSIKERYEGRPGYSWSYLVKLYYAGRIVRDFTDRFRDDVLRSYLGEDDDRKVWRNQQVALRKIGKICRENGIDLHLIVFPVLFELDDYPYDAVEAEVLRFASEAGIPAFSLIEGFRGREPRSLWVAENDQHPNEKGHRIAAETLYPYLRQAIDSTLSPGVMK